MFWMGCRWLVTFARVEASRKHGHGVVMSPMRRTSPLS
jgi:hypothetical protein